MTESQIRALFNEIADGAAGPSPVDPQAALRRGRARLRRRRACQAGVPLLAAAAVIAVILALVAGPFRPGGRPVAPSPGPPAPRQFNPLIPNAAFGWLPAGQSVQQGGVAPAEVVLAVGSTTASTWSVYAYARGQCHLTGPARGLDCAPRTPYGMSLRFSAPAPAVHGHPAFWAGNWLVWQYARGGWAGLLSPVYNVTLQHDKALRGQALKIATHLRMGATSPPILFPARLTGPTSQWQLQYVHYWAVAGLLQADSYTLTTGTSRYVRHVGDQEGIWTNAPYFDIHLAPDKTGTCVPHDPSSKNTSELLNGYHVVLKRSTARGYPKQEVCAAHADGLWADIVEFGQHLTSNVTSLFRQLRLLGANPANWTRHPIR